MVLNKSLRPLSKKILNKIKLYKLFLKIPPNVISVFTVPFAAIACYLIVQQKFLLAILFLIISILLDLTDGNVARETKKVSNFGKYLDPIMDKYVEILIYLGFMFLGFKTETFLAITGIMLIGSSKSWAFQVIPLKNFDWPSIGERTDRYSILIIGTILATFYPTIQGYTTLSLTLYLIAVLAHLGAIQRIFFAKKLIQSS